MYFLRNHAFWVAKFEAAMALLKTWRTEVARTTVNIIKKNIVIIRPFLKLTRADLLAAKKLIKNSDNLVNTKSNTTIAKKLEKNLCGFIINNRIYISETLTDKKFAKTLVHEVNHYLNDSPEQKDNVFENELRAHISERMAEGKLITRQYIKKISMEVSSLYQVPMPENVKMPLGKYSI